MKAFYVLLFFVMQSSVFFPAISSYNLDSTYENQRSGHSHFSSRRKRYTGYTVIYEAFHKWGYPKKWLVYNIEIPLKWMMTRGTPISGNHHIRQFKLQKDRKGIVTSQAKRHRIGAAGKQLCLPSKHGVKTPTIFDLVANPKLAAVSTHPVNG